MGAHLPALVAFGVSLALAAANWVAIWLHRRRWEWVLKPLAQGAVLLAAVLLTAAPHDSRLARYLVPSLALSLVGDISLLARDKGFLPGLVAFLLAHVSTIVGLTPSLPPPTALAFLIPVAIFAVLIFRGIERGLRARGHEALLLPVGTYTAVICLMAAAAWATWLRPGWTPLRSALASAGATLFTVSDAMLAWDRFRTPSRSGPVRVMVTYHLAQMCLAASLARW